MCVGFASHGEHNKLRAMGYTRPVSVLRIKADVKAKFSKFGEKRLLKMINPLGTVNYNIGYCHISLDENYAEEQSVLVAEDNTSMVPTEVLQEILNWRKDGISLDDIISRLRSRTVPSGYPIHTWKDGI